MEEQTPMESLMEAVCLYSRIRSQVEGRAGEPWAETYSQACYILREEGDIDSSVEMWIGLLGEEGLVPNAVAIGAGDEIANHLVQMQDYDLTEEPDLSPVGDLLMALAEADLRDAVRLCIEAMMCDLMGAITEGNERSSLSKLTYLLGLVTMQIIRSGQTMSSVSSITNTVILCSEITARKDGGRPVPQLERSKGFFEDLRSATVPATSWGTDLNVNRTIAWRQRGFGELYDMLESVRTGYVDRSMDREEGRRVLAEFMDRYASVGEGATEAPSRVCIACMRRSPMEGDLWYCRHCGSRVDDRSLESLPDHLTDLIALGEGGGIMSLLKVIRGRGWQSAHAEACAEALDDSMEYALESWGAVASMTGADPPTILRGMMECLITLVETVDGGPGFTVGSMTDTLSALEGEGDLSFEDGVLSLDPRGGGWVWQDLFTRMALVSVARAGSRGAAMDAVVSAYMTCEDLDGYGFYGEFLDLLYNMLDGMDDATFEGRGDAGILDEALSRVLMEEEAEESVPVLEEYFGIERSRGHQPAPGLGEWVEAYQLVANLAVQLGDLAPARPEAGPGGPGQHAEEPGVEQVELPAVLQQQAAEVRRTQEPPLLHRPRPVGRAPAGEPHGPEGDVDLQGHHVHMDHVVPQVHHQGGLEAQDLVLQLPELGVHPEPLGADCREVLAGVHPR